MKVTLGKEGLSKTWQDKFPETTECSRCNGVARIGFVAHELLSKNNEGDRYICSLHENEGKGNFWLHDACAVAIYFCKECLEVKALYNQA